jgi:hypothetical protein
MRIKLTRGITMPTDFNASVTHKLHRPITEGQIVDSPRIANVVAMAAYWTGESSRRRTPCIWISESGNADINELLECLELRETKLNP